MAKSRKPGSGRYLGNERGMLLVLTMVVLLVLSSLAGASLVNSLLERSQARSLANAAIALNAAEAGVAAGMAWLSDPDNIDNYPTTPTDVPDPTRIANAYTTNTNWKKWRKELQRTLPNGGSYTVSLTFARERRDRNNDGDCCDTYPAVPIDEDGEFQDGDTNSCTDADQCYQPDPGNPNEPIKVGEVLLYNLGSGDGHFGFSNSYYSGNPGDEGFPVVEIESLGTHGATSTRQIALQVARNHKAQIEGAFTARASVTATGSSMVDGSNYNIAGTGPGSCGSDQPGVTVDVAGTAPPCGTNIVSGTATCSENYDPTTEPGGRLLAKTPWDVLSMSETDFRSMFTKDDAATNIPQPCSASPYYLWFSRESINFNNSSGCTSYTGILVVHNEGFNPDSWEANCPDAASMASAFCSNPANQPAVFDMNGNVRWTGIVIADQVMLVNGTPTIIGGVYSLASGGYNVRSEISGNITVKYSCDAVSAVTGSIGYKRKIGWQRLR